MNDNKAKIAVLLDLFKIMPDDERTAPLYRISDSLRYGFIVVDSNCNIVRTMSQDRLNMIRQRYGTCVEAFNQTFHKSFGTVAEMSDDEYYAQQVAHYFTTYGAAALGITGMPTYIPVEKLEIPELKFNINKITVITVMSEQQIAEVVNKFVKNTTAPSKRMVHGFEHLIDYIDNVDNIFSFELKVVYYQKTNTLPCNARDILRYICYLATGSTLLVKNKQTINAIRHCRYHDEIVKAMMGVTPAKHAAIFYANKPLYLAIKANDPRLRHFINTIRKAAPIFHQPSNEVSVQNFMNLIAASNTRAISEIIVRSSNRELIKLLNAISIKLSATQRVFNIRTGAVYVAPNTDNNDKNYFDIVCRIYRALVARLYPHLKGKTFYVPEYINYAAPVSAKQFVDNIPWGSSIACPEDKCITAAIQWYNGTGKMVDLDLHLNSDSGTHFGWNGYFKEGKNNVIYSGDMTNAPLPNGAAEAFWFNPWVEENFILSINAFSGESKIPFKFGMTLQVPDTKKDYTFSDPIFTPIPLHFNDGAREMNLGVFSNGCFYFYGGHINTGIIPKKDYTGLITGIVEKCQYSLMLNELLNDCGATVIRKLPEEASQEEFDSIINLSPESLTATTLLDIVDAHIQSGNGAV